MIKDFLKDTSIYTFGLIISRGMALIMLPVFTRLLSPSDYGFIDIVIIISGFAVILFTMEINQGFGRYYSESNNQQDRIIYSSTALIFVIFSYLILLLILLVFEPFFGRFLLVESTNYFLYILSIAYILGYGIFVFLQNQLRWYLKSKEYVVVSVTYTLLSYLLSVVLMYFYKMGVTGFFIGMITGHFAAILLSWFFSRNILQFSFDFGRLKQMLKFSFPLVPSSIGVIVLLYINRLAIKDLLTLHEVGLFGIAYRFAAVISLILMGFQTALAPLIYQNYKKETTPSEIEKIFRLFIIIVLSLTLGLSVFAKEIIMLFTTPEYYESYTIIPLISFATIFLSINLFTPGLLLAKKTKMIAIINIFGAVLNTILNYSFIPHFGIIGSASATVISGIIIFGLNYFFSQKNYYIPFNIRKIIISFGLVAISVQLMVFLDGNVDTIFLLVIKAIIVFAGFLFLSEYLIGRKNLIKSIRNLRKS
jgi:O-antigen/teichoic acid export membrane protein